MEETIKDRTEEKGNLVINCKLTFSVIIFGQKCRQKVISEGFVWNTISEAAEREGERQRESLQSQKPTLGLLHENK